MDLNEAVQLIKTQKLSSTNKQIWADLGCGAGTFTPALAQLLNDGSIIYAVDTNKQVLSQIPETYHNVSVKKVNADFTNDQLNLPQLDGILMANSLHFVEDKIVFLSKLEEFTTHFLIVEYENERPNAWVPFPITFQSLKELFGKLGYSEITRLATKKSIFGGEMYSAVIEK